MNTKTTVKSGPQHVFAHEFFELQARRTPDHFAAKFNGAYLTYAELNCKANQLATKLRLVGVRPDSIVGVCVERGFGLLISLLGVLKSGGTYLPLDPAYPAQRLQFLVRDSAPRVLIVETGTEHTVRVTATQIVNLDKLASVPVDDVPMLGNVQNLAYVIYTSGSTGYPKGVTGPHCALSNRISWAQSVPLFTSAARYLHTTSVGFLDSVTASLGALAAGSCIHIASDEMMRNVSSLHNAIVDGEITHLVLVPAVMRALVNFAGSSLGSLSLVISSGQRLDDHLAEAVARAWPSVTLINLYGCSEVAGDSTWHIVCSAKATPSKVLIGKPISNTDIYLLDEARNPVPHGTIGEIYIAGVGLAHGYLNRPDLTRERFIPALAGISEDRLYKTGDLALQLPDGALQYVGRIDDQIKLRGFRVEPNEIECALLGHEAVSEAVVVAVAAGLSEPQLAAGVVLRPQFKSAGVDSLQPYLRRILPEYMVPTRWKALDALPLSPHGKVDRAAVAVAIATSDGCSTGRVAPRSKLEQDLVHVWAEVLGNNSLGIDDNLFDMGAHSLNVVEARLRLESILQKPVSLDTFYAARTIASQALRLEALQRDVTRQEACDYTAGTYPLTPAQARFFDSEAPSQQSINILELLVSTNKPIAHMIKAINFVMARHDTFHTVRFPVLGGIRQQEIGDHPIFNLTQFGCAANPQELIQRCSEARYELDLASGPYCSWRVGAMSNQTYAYFVCHHLLCDAVSMNVLYWELNAALDGTGEQLSIPSTLKRWLSANVKASSIAELFCELPYWSEVVANRGNAVTSMLHASGQQASEALTLSGSRVANLTRADILGCLLHAFAKTFACDTVRCRIVDSGRGIRPEVDDSLTVGWLAHHVPFRFKVVDSLSETVAMTAAALSRVPNRGSGYGWLRYHSQVSELIEGAQLIDFPLYFNHLYSSSPTSSVGLRNEKELLQRHQVASDLRIAGIAVLAFQSTSQITFNVLYAKEHIDLYLVKNLLRRLEDCLTRRGSELLFGLHKDSGRFNAPTPTQDQ